MSEEEIVPKVEGALEGQPSAKRVVDTVIDLRAHPKFMQRQQEEKLPESVQEDSLLAQMKSATVVLGTRHTRAWDRVREFSGTVFPETEEGEKNFHDLRIPRKKLDSQRARINQLRGRLQAAIRDGELKSVDDVVPWFSTDGEKENEYRKQYALLQANDARVLIKKYSPLVKQLDSFQDERALQKFLDSLDKRTHAIVDLVQNIRQVEHDSALFDQLFDEKKNPAFLQAFKDREQGVEKKRQKPSKEKRDRLKERENTRLETSPGAQMRWVLEWNGAEITLERNREGWAVTRIDDPKRILTRQEMSETLGSRFSDLSKAPLFLRDAAREKGLI